MPVTLGRAPKAAAASRTSVSQPTPATQAAHSSARTARLDFVSDIGPPSPVRWLIYRWFDAAAL